MTALESPAWRRDRPLWAEMLGAPDRPWTGWAGDRAIAAFPAGVPAQARPARAYLLGGGVAAGDFLGEYDGEPAWMVGDMFLFRSKARGKWVLKADFLEPAAWTRTTLGADGSEAEEAFGDTWWEADSLAMDEATGEVEFACAGKDAEDARIAGDPAPDPERIGIGGPVWVNASGGPEGEYSPVAGTGAAGTVRVGHWSWTVDGGEAWAMDPGDRTRVLSAATGAATPCPDGKWAVRRGEGGAWAADLSDGEYGAGLQCSWEPDEGAPADGEAPRVEWAGLAAVPAPEPVYVYQPSRFL